MDLTVIIQVAIGMMFLWILLALITSQAVEWISSLLKWRANMLEDAVRNLVSSGQLFEEFYRHPLIKGLHTNKGRRKPSCIPKEQFTVVVLDIFLRAGTKDSPSLRAKPIFSQLKEKIREVSENEGDEKGNLAHALETLLIDVAEKTEKADEGLAETRQRMEAWFDDAMERLSGAFKRRIQITTLIIGLVVAAATNADSLAIANSLWTDPLLREAVVAQAEQFQLPEDQAETDPQQEILQYSSEVQNLNIPIGWSPENIPCTTWTPKDTPCDPHSWLLKVGGIIASGAAAAQGAPFWFEIMRKALDLRSGPKPEKEEEK